MTSEAHEIEAEARERQAKAGLAPRAEALYAEVHERNWDHSLDYLELVLGQRVASGREVTADEEESVMAALKVPQKAEPMKIGDTFPSKYLKQDDLKGKRILVTIDRVVVEDVGQGAEQERKAVVYFLGAEKGWVLSARINADEITSIVGDDETDHWKGHKIVLYVDPSVMFGGKRVGGIRVAPPPQGQGKPSAPPPPPPEIVEGFQADDSDVPF